MNEKNKRFSQWILILTKDKIEIFNPSRSVFKFFDKNKGICKLNRFLERSKGDSSRYNSLKTSSDLIGK